MTQPDIILEARGVGKRFGGVRALGNIDFTLRRGELRCLIGPNGAGKSTFKLLSGQMAPSEGDVLFDGRSIRRAAACHRAGAWASRTRCPPCWTA